MPLERKKCQDCELDLPLKQFALYVGKRHPLCRTCLAIDVAEFKAYVLPFVEERRRQREIPYRWEDWEWAVVERLELSMAQKATLIQRGRVRRVREMRRPERYGPEIIRPWKHLVDA